MLSTLTAPVTTRKEPQYVDVGTLRSNLYCYVGIHLLFIFLISLCLGLCLTQCRCVFTVVFNDSDFEQLRDILAPLFFIFGLFYNVFVVGWLLPQLATSQPGSRRHAAKKP